jgi:hypothetical protein
MAVSERLKVLTVLRREVRCQYCGWRSHHFRLRKVRFGELLEFIVEIINFSQRVSVKFKRTLSWAVLFGDERLVKPGILFLVKEYY